MSVKIGYKTYIQLILIVLIIVITYFTYSYYFVSNKNNLYQSSVKSITNENKLLNTLENSELKKGKDTEADNFIKKIEYNSKDLNGNNYFIAAETGEISTIDSNIILMYSVSATITLTDFKIINIFAEEAKYNLQNYNTEFSGNIKIIYADNKIFTENLDFNFKDGKINAYNNLIMESISNNTKLEADRVEIDLITKNSKIFPKDNSKKISIIKTN